MHPKRQQHLINTKCPTHHHPDIISLHSDQDHFNDVNKLPPPMKKSLHIQESSKKKKKMNKSEFSASVLKNKYILKQISERLEENALNRSPLSSISSSYNCSFENLENIGPPSRKQNNQTFFPKQNPLQPPESIFHPMSNHLKQKRETIKGKKRSNYLSILKHKKMNVNSVHQPDLQDKGTFPLIIKAYNEGKEECLRS